MMLVFLGLKLEVRANHLVDLKPPGRFLSFTPHPAPCRRGTPGPAALTKGSPLYPVSTEHYKHHWFPEKPSKGSGYRCIRINHKMDPIISKVASQIGLSQPQLHRLLPRELTLWVDPYEVSYRIGEDGSICVLYEEAPLVASYGLLTCKNQMMLGRRSPPKNYVMAVSS
ncbi:PREDICTED: protein BTG2 [Myotis davidii]|uniref:Protein BTG2 n=1 Tax=Myotis davidii TaxID=225400 RepID=L5LDG0_MYODS|nr:PREDICTED: protein BTG2 [Myotis davidii]ELK24030.1 Protein BTG2 [Myotis davidii]